MKIEYDPKHDIMNIVFIDEKIVESNEYCNNERQSRSNSSIVHRIFKTRR